MLHTPPIVDIRAWLTLAVTGPAGLLTLARAMTGVASDAREAGFCASVLMALMFLLALSRLEVRTLGWGVPSPIARPAREALLISAFCITTVEACTLLISVMAGAPLSGQMIAGGLTVAAAPLALAVAIYGLAQNAQTASSPAELAYAS